MDNDGGGRGGGGRFVTFHDQIPGVFCLFYSNLDFFMETIVLESEDQSGEYYIISQSKDAPHTRCSSPLSPRTSPPSQSKMEAFRPWRLSKVHIASPQLREAVRELY